MAEPALPPGWTVETLLNATTDDYADLTDEQSDALVAYEATPGYRAALEAHLSVKSAAIGAQLRESQNAERARLGMPPRPDTPPEIRAAVATGSQLVETVVKQGFQDDWGFLVFRTDYTDEEAWEMYNTEFMRLVDKSIVDDNAESIHDGCMMKTVDDENLQGITLRDVRDQFHGLKEVGEVPSGLDVEMCLVVDKAAIASVTEKQPIPYVLAVDVNYVEDDENNEEGYEGFFKVAIPSVLPDLYPPLGMHGMLPDELWPFAKPIFTNAYGLDD